MTSRRCPQHLLMSHLSGQIPVLFQHIYESQLEISMLSINEDDTEVSLWIDEKEQQHEKSGVINHAIAQLTEGRYSPIASTLNTSWDDVSVTQQQYYQRKVRGSSSGVIGCCSGTRRTHVELPAGRTRGSKCRK